MFGRLSDLMERIPARLYRIHIIDKEPELDKCQYHVVDAKVEQAKLTNLLTYYDLLRKYVEHEDELVNSRLTWSFTIHAFLFAAYGVLLGKALDLASGLQQSVLPFGVSLDTFIQSLAVSFAALVIGVLAIFIGRNSGTAIVASHNALQHVFSIAHNAGDVNGEKQVRFQGALVLEPRGQDKGQLLLPKILGGGAKDMSDVRAHPYYLKLPTYIIFAWFALILVNIAVIYDSTTSWLSSVAASKSAIRSAANAIDRLRRDLPRDVYLTGIDSIDLVHGASPALEDETWHIRASFHNDKRPRLHQDYKADEFIPAKGGAGRSPLIFAHYP